MWLIAHGAGIVPFLTVQRAADVAYDTWALYT